MSQEYIKVKGVAYSRSIPKNERLTKKQIQQGLESIIGKKKKVARIFKPFLKKLVPMTLEEDLEWMEKFTAWLENPYDDSGKRKERPKMPKGKCARIL